MKILPSGLIGTIQQISIADLSLSEAVRLTDVYIRLYRSVCIDESARSVWGTASDVYSRLQSLSGRLVDFLFDPTLSRDEKARCAATVMDAYQTSADRQRLDRAIEAAYDLLDLDGLERISLQEPVSEAFVHLLIALDYFVPDEKAGKIASDILSEWFSDRQNHRDWSVLSDLQSSDRMSLLIRYQSQIGEPDFDDMIRGGLEYQSDNLAERSSRLRWVGNVSDYGLRSRYELKVNSILSSIPEWECELDLSFSIELFDLYIRLSESKLYK